MTALLVCLCGGLGAVARFVLNTSIQRWWSRAFPLSTFVINVIATFCAGVAAAAYASMAVEQSTYLLFVTGFLGGFSTFSTAINEVVSLARNGRFAMAGWYLLATVVVPIVCVALGWMVGSLGRCTGGRDVAVPWVRRRVKGRAPVFAGTLRRAGTDGCRGMSARLNSYAYVDEPCRAPFGSAVTDGVRRRMSG